MNAGNVARLVGLVGDCAHARKNAADLSNDTQALRARVESLEAAVDTLCEVLLSGTSADPDKPAAKKAAKKVAK